MGNRESVRAAMTWDKAQRKADADRLRALGTSNNPRDRHGCICTVRDEDTGRLVTLHRNGFRLDALAAVAAWCDATPGDWKVVSYSTPETIRGDLSDMRTFENGGLGGRKGEWGSTTIAYPEVSQLGRIGRADLIAPEHLAHIDTEQRLRYRQRMGYE